jgi:hypothetical protein
MESKNGVNMNPNIIPVHKGLLVMGGFFAIIGILIVAAIIYFSIEAEVSTWWQKWKWDRKSAKNDRLKAHLATQFKGKSFDKVYGAVYTFLCNEKFL